MNTTPEFIFAISLFVTLFMGGLSYLSSRGQKSKDFLHLTEFWAALSLNVIVSFLLQNEKPQIIALSMVGWIWPLRAFKLVLEDISGTSIKPRWQYMALAVGGFITVALASYQSLFVSYTLPFALSVGVVGMAGVMEAFRKTPRALCSSLHCATYLMMGLYFAQKMTFPYWRLDPQYQTLGFMSELITLIGFAGLGLSVYLEVMKNRYERQHSDVVKEKNNKLLGQSKFSELGMMSAGIAHEINNPLAVIQARTTQLLRIYRDASKQKELSDGLEQILYTSERINRTIQGVREFVHQDEQTTLSEMTLKALVDDVLAFCGQRMKNHGVSLRFYDLEKYTVKGNKIQLEQIMLNLFNNSFDAIEFLSEKWIEISVQQNKDVLEIFFKDSGTGIPGDIADRIMEPFFSTKDLGKGTGLGLALAKGIAEKHHGHLSYVKGAIHTTFLLELPRSGIEVYNTWNIPGSNQLLPLQH